MKPLEVTGNYREKWGTWIRFLVFIKKFVDLISVGNFRLPAVLTDKSDDYGIICNFRPSHEYTSRIRTNTCPPFAIVFERFCPENPNNERKLAVKENSLLDAISRYTYRRESIQRFCKSQAKHGSVRLKFHESRVQWKGKSLRISLRTSQCLNGKINTWES